VVLGANSDRARRECYRAPVNAAHAVSLAICLASLGACHRSRPAPDQRAVQQCLAAHVEFLTGLSAGQAGGHEALACPELYQETSCGNAWQDLLRRVPHRTTPSGVQPVDVPDLAAVVAPCTHAYCGKLAAPLPQLCTGPVPQDNAALVDEVQALDAAILEHDLGDPQVASALAWKARVFRVIMLDLPKPAADAGTPLQMVFSVDVVPGEVRIDGNPVSDDDLLARAKHAREQNEDIRAVIRADKRVTHGVVIHVLDLLKQAGINKIAFGVDPVEPQVSASATTR
jgi:biopolymer transport protein ExbD